jgi:hypothetical protein
MGQRVALQVQYDQCATGNSPQFGDQLDRLAVWKMVQKRRAEHKIEGFRQEGKVKSICCDSWRLGIV